MAVLLMHCNQVKSVLELTAFSLICPTVLAFLMGGAASTPLATGASTPLPEAIAAPLAEAIATHFFSTSRQVTRFAPFLPHLYVWLPVKQKTKEMLLDLLNLAQACNR